MKRLRLKNYDWNRSVAISYVIAKKMHHIEWCLFFAHRRLSPLTGRR